MKSALLKFVAVVFGTMIVLGLFAIARPAGGVAGTLIENAQPAVAMEEAGNTVYVDSVFGNDSTCARQGLACRTPEKAVTLALSGDVILFRPGTYTLAAATGTGLTVPDGVVLEGTGQRSTTLAMTATGNATLLKFAAGTTAITVRDIGLTLTGAGAHTLAAVEYDSTRSATAAIRRCTITVNSTNVGAATAYGVYSSGTGQPSYTFYALNNDSIVVNASGTGTYRGIYADSAAMLRAKVTNVGVYGTGNGDHRGIQTNNAAAEVEMQGGGAYGNTSGGANFSDILQTSGEIELAGGAYLEGHTAGGKSLTAYPEIASRFFCDPAGTTNGTRYMYPGTASVSMTQVPLRNFVAGSAFRLSMNCRVAPAANTVTVTLQAGPAGAIIDTLLLTSLTGVATYSEATNLSVDLAAGQFYDVKIVANGTTAQDCCVQLKVY